MLTVDKLHSYYDDSHVLRGVNLEVESNEVLVLLGRNGMGKTTLIRSIMNLSPPQVRDGTILFDHHDITEWAPYRIASTGVALVPQGRRIFKTLTVEENLEVARRQSAEPSRSEEYDLNRIFNLFPRLNRRRSHIGSQLSGGEQQMFAIGRFLMNTPRLTLIDEPSEALGPKLADILLERIQVLKEENLSLLVVEQNLEFGLKVAERVNIMERGKIVHEGSPEELRGNKELQEAYLGIRRD